MYFDADFWSTLTPDPVEEDLYFFFTAVSDEDLLSYPPIEETP